MMAQSRKRNIWAVVITNIWLLAIVCFMTFVYPNLSSYLPGVVFNIFGMVLWWYLLLIPIAFFMRRDKEKPRDIGFTKEKLPRQILLGIVLAICTLVVFNTISLVSGMREFHWGGAAYISIAIVLGSFALNLLTVALVEEIIYRGHMFRKLQNINHASWFAVTVSAICFGLLHIPSFIFIHGIGWYPVLIATLIGVVYGVCRMKRATMLTLIIAHAIHNAIQGQVLPLMHY